MIEGSRGFCHQVAKGLAFWD